MPDNDDHEIPDDRQPRPPRPSPPSGDDPAPDDVWERLARLPSLDDVPVDETWVRRRRADPPASATEAPSEAHRDPGPVRDDGPGAEGAGTGPDSGAPSHPDAAARSAGYAPPGQFHVPAPGEAVPAGPNPAGPAAAAGDHREASMAALTQDPDTDPPGNHPAPRRRRRRRWPLRLALALVVLVVVAGVVGFFVAWTTWNNVDKVAIDGLATDTTDGTNYLIVGTDSRAGVDPDLETAGGILGEDPSQFDDQSARTDTIVVLRVAPDGNRFLSLNRDLWLPLAGGGEQRINAAFNSGGPERLVATIQQSLGLPIHHYLEVDFAGFLGLVDTLGGIDVEVAHPAFDPTTGLDIPTAGLVHLDAEQALAYVRTRNYVEIIDGQQVRDPTSDFGRVQRQQAFLEAVFDKVGGSRNPITLLRAARSLSGNVRIDDSWGFWEALGFGRGLDGLDPESIPLPVFDFTGPNGEAVLGLADDAEAVLARFR